MRKIPKLLFCLLLTLLLAVPALAEEANPNHYDVELSAAGSTFRVYVTQTEGADPIGHFVLNFTSTAAFSGFETKNASGFSAFATEDGFQLSRSGGAYALTPDEKTLVGVVTLAAPCALRVETQAPEDEGLNGISNPNQRLEAGLRVILTQQTAAPVFLSGSLSLGLEESETTAELSAAPEPGTVFQVYDAEGALQTGVRATANGTQLTLHFDAAPTAAARYYIAAQLGTLEQSEKTALAINAQVEERTVSVLFPVAPAGENFQYLAAQYSTAGKLIGIVSVELPDPSAACTLTLLDGAASCKLFACDEGNFPVCENAAWTQSAQN